MRAVRKHVVVGVAVAVVVVAKLVAADDDLDRRDLLARIDSRLDAAAHELYSFERESDASNVDVKSYNMCDKQYVCVSD